MKDESKCYSVVQGNIVQEKQTLRNQNMVRASSSRQRRSHGDRPYSKQA